MNESLFRCAMWAVNFLLLGWALVVQFQVPTVGPDSGQVIVTVCVLLCECVRHVVCVNIELTLGKTWISSSSPRAWPSHVAADRGCGSLARLSIIECYCAAVQFPATPLHALGRVRLACHRSFSRSGGSLHLCCLSNCCFLRFNAHGKTLDCYRANMLLIYRRPPRLICWV